MLLQYSKEDPRIRQDPVTAKWRVPMRCSGCGVNIDITVDPKDLEEEQEDSSWSTE